MSPFKLNEKSTLGLEMLLRNYHATTISCHANGFSILIGGWWWWGSGATYPLTNFAES